MQSETKIKLIVHRGKPAFTLRCPTNAPVAWANHFIKQPASMSADGRIGMAPRIDAAQQHSRSGVFA